MDPFYGVDLNDPSSRIDIDKLSDIDADRIPEIKRWFIRFFGEAFADQAESAVLKGGSITTKRKLNNSSTRHFYSRLSPIITRNHTVSFYNDPRDIIPSNLGDKEESVGAEYCCDRCQHLTGTVEGLRTLMSAEGNKHYTCNEIRRQPASTYCPFCDLVRRIMVHCTTCAQSAMGEGMIRILGIVEDIATHKHPFQPAPRLEAFKIKIPLEPRESSSYSSHHDHELDLLTYEESPTALFVVGRRPDKKLTPDLIRRMRTWLTVCQDKHESCSRNRPSVLPTRVVDIGNGKSSPIRLQINQRGTQGKYAALSYCWGGDQPYKTTTSNLDSYIKDLSSIVFPKTLSDAIQVCREVGLRYIWIDALCIIQNDPNDKAREISQMGKIYKDATFTIMAASAKSVYEGFLDNAKIDAPEAKLPFHIDEDSVGAIFVRGPVASHSYFLDEEPIFSRAWTFQELLLSSRIIMFDSYQVTLKCGQKSFWPAMDTYLHPELRISSRIGSGHETLKEFRLGKLAEEHWEQAPRIKQNAEGFVEGSFSIQCQIWAMVMAEYSRRDMSVLDDRYRALAGLTEELQNIWGGEYVAGFWKESLVQHLGWVGGVSANEQFGGKKWEKTLGGPSWSWMSHPSSISIDPIAITDVQVLGCETELEFPNQPFGPVKKGSLTLKARVLQLSDLQTKIRPNINPVWKRVLAIMPSGIDGIALDFPDQPIAEGELKALALGLTYSTVGEHCASFLVLRKLIGDTYVRIGHAVLHTAFTEKTAAIMKKAKWEVIVIE